MTDEPIAPEGKIYVCSACGKTSRGLFGTNGHRWWDASCMLNAVLASESDIERDPSGRVTRINGDVEQT